MTGSTADIALPSPPETVLQFNTINNYTDSGNNANDQYKFNSYYNNSNSGAKKLQRSQSNSEKFVSSRAAKRMGFIVSRRAPVSTEANVTAVPNIPLGYTTPIKNNNTTGATTNGRIDDAIYNNNEASNYSYANPKSHSSSLTSINTIQSSTSSTVPTFAINDARNYNTTDIGDKNYSYNTPARRRPRYSHAHSHTEANINRSEIVFFNLQPDLNLNLNLNLKSSLSPLVSVSVPKVDDASGISSSVLTAGTSSPQKDETISHTFQLTVNEFTKSQGNSNDNNKNSSEAESALSSTKGTRSNLNALFPNHGNSAGSEGDAFEEIEFSLPDQNQNSYTYYKKNNDINSVNDNEGSIDRKMLKYNHVRATSIDNVHMCSTSNSLLKTDTPASKSMSASKSPLPSAMLLKSHSASTSPTLFQRATFDHEPSKTKTETKTRINKKENIGPSLDKTSEYFHRLSTLPELPPQNKDKKEQGQKKSQLLKFSRKLLFAFSELYSALKKYNLINNTQSRLRDKMIAMLLLSKRQINALVEGLEKSDYFEHFDENSGNGNTNSNNNSITSIKTKTAIELEEKNGLILQSVISSMSIFKQIMILMMDNIHSMTDKSDVCFIRVLLLAIYGCYSEIYNAHMMITPSLEKSCKGREKQNLQQQQEQQQQKKQQKNFQHKRGVSMLPEMKTVARMERVPMSTNIHNNNPFLVSNNNLNMNNTFSKNTTATKTIRAAPALSKVVTFNESSNNCASNTNNRVSFQDVKLYDSTKFAIEMIQKVSMTILEILNREKSDCKSDCKSDGNNILNSSVSDHPEQLQQAQPLEHNTEKLKFLCQSVSATVMLLNDTLSILITDSETVNFNPNTNVRVNAHANSSQSSNMSNQEEDKEKTSNGNNDDNDNDNGQGIFAPTRQQAKMALFGNIELLVHTVIDILSTAKQVMLDIPEILTLRADMSSLSKVAKVLIKIMELNPVKSLH